MATRPLWISVVFISDAIDDTITVKERTASGCWATLQQIVDVDTFPTITATHGGSPICETETIQLYQNDVGTIPTTSWVWSGPASFSSSARNPTRPNALPAHSGTYQVIAYTDEGCPDTATVAVTVTPAPAITTHPTAQAVCSGSNVSFTVAASGTSLAYQWQESTNGGSSWSNLSNGGIYSGVTTTTLSLSGVSTTMHNYQYRCVVTGTCSPPAPAAVSNAATLTINDVAITAHPSSVNKCIGTSHTFTVTATGASPQYQWRKNGTNISGATNASYVISSIAAGDAGSYDVVVSNSCNSVTSNAATLTVDDIVITAHPSSVNKCSGTSHTFTVTATGASPQYQWRKNGTNISGATNASYVISSIAAGDAGSYDVVVSNSCNSVTSNAATLTVDDIVITAHPSSVNKCSGTSHTFTVTATGASPQYQWRKNGTNISGATNASYVISSITAGDAGSYDVVVSNSCNSVTSNAATLTVDDIVITAHPSSVNKCSGTSHTFTVTATGASPQYQWRKNGTNISGATNASYVISSIAAGDAGSYDVVVSNSCNSVTSNAATLTVDDIVITAHPSSVNKCIGTSHTFTVTATGASPQYQWRKNGTNISGATNASYVISSIAAGDAGSYDVVVSNSCNSVTSNAATLTVDDIVITAHPSSTSSCVGSSVTFTVSYTGTNPTFQWRKNGTNISGATNASYVINSVVAGDAGSYDVVLSNSCNSVTSNSATLTVNNPPAAPTGIAVKVVYCTDNNTKFTLLTALNPPSGATLRWYSGSSCGGSQIGTGTTLTINSNGQQYYSVLADNGSCTSACVATSTAIYTYAGGFPSGQAHNEAYWDQRGLSTRHDVEIRTNCSSSGTVYSWDATNKFFKDNAATPNIMLPTGTQTVASNSFPGYGTNTSWNSNAFQWDDQNVLSSSVYDAYPLFVSPLSAVGMTFCKAMENDYAGNCPLTTSSNATDCVVIDGDSSTLLYAPPPYNDSYDVSGKGNTNCPAEGMINAGSLKTGCTAIDEIFQQQQLDAASDKSYCQATYGKGWRLPTDIEMGHTNDCTTTGNGFDDGFRGNTSFTIWSSAKGNGDYRRWGMNISTGSWANTIPINVSTTVRVRCVYDPMWNR
ncbi:MAG: hypothetical protein KatS3mg031_2633 [Chitinophagales bacterium]|nr:MAG: hypothetical protein KatS3mg031_2633 [Chitinophagales bacterium]